MAKSTTDITKTLTLAPGDPGPTCSYSPYCSPKNLTVWREATYTMTETRVPPNHEVLSVRKWILQLVQRELTRSLGQAERALGYRLDLKINDQAAQLINKALKLRAGASRRRRKS